MINVAHASINSFAQDSRQNDSVPPGNQWPPQKWIKIDPTKYFAFLKIASDNYEETIKEIDIRGLILADQLSAMVAEFKDKVLEESRPVRKISMIMGENTRLRRKYLLEEVE
ncbi:Uncharacterised protein [uncultured archaeon]|nr:Uncharacterised protein [uncultured archaeon]